MIRLLSPQSARFRRSPLLAALPLASLLAACGSDTEPLAPPLPPPPATVARVAVTPDRGALTVGGTLALSAYTISAAGDTLRDRAITWRTDNAAVATITPAGVVVGVASGSVAVWAKSGNAEAAALISVSPRAVSSVTLDASLVEFEEGATRQVVASVRDADGAELPGRTVSWTSSDASVATVNASGLVSAVRSGVATITASVEGKSSAATVRVSSRFAFDLLFDSRTGYSNAPELYVLDPRAPLATPARIALPFTGASDVTPSPDGTRIVFVGREPHGPQLFVARRDGSDVRLLTSESGGADQPAWSPDGNRIAYRAWKAGGPPGIFNASDIKVVNIDGSGAVSLTAFTGTGVAAQSPTWSPRGDDGRFRIAYSRQEKTGEYLSARIMSVRDDGSDSRAVTPASDNYDTEPAWSPNGEAIVFVRRGAFNPGDLFVYSIATGTSRPLFTADPADDQRSPAWSPDGTMIAFASNHEPGENGSYFFQLYTVQANGTGLTRRTPSGPDKENPAWIRRP